MRRIYFRALHFVFLLFTDPINPFDPIYTKKIENPNICRFIQDAHSDKRIFTIMTELEPAPEKHPRRTEDTGIHLESVLCDVLGIPCNNKNKNDYRAEFREEAEMLVPRLRQMSETHGYQQCGFTHTAAGGNPYDYTSTINPDIRLSLKSAKYKDKAKVAPHTIGQASPLKFAELVGASASLDGAQVTLEERQLDQSILKKWIQENTTAVLEAVTKNTFDCPVIYYNKGASTLQHICLRTPIDWSTHEYVWTRPYAQWNNSSTLKVRLPDGKYRAILEVQFHSKSRSNMAVRWAFDALLVVFAANFDITRF